MNLKNDIKSAAISLLTNLEKLIDLRLREMWSGEKCPEKWLQEMPAGWLEKPIGHLLAKRFVKEKFSAYDGIGGYDLNRIDEWLIKNAVLAAVEGFESSLAER